MDRTEKNGKWLNLYDTCATILEEGVNHKREQEEMMRKGKRLTALLLALVLCLSVLPAGVLASEAEAAEVVSPSAMAVTSGKCGKNLTWKLDGNGTLTISGKGEMDHYWGAGSRSPWEDSCNKIKKVVIKNGVTGIGGYAFFRCKKLKSVELGNSLRDINAVAFGECEELKRITIPKSVEYIGETAFTRCSKLTEIRFNGDAPSFAGDGSGVNYIFEDVTATVYYPKGNKTWTSDKLQNYGGKLTWKTWSPNQPKGVFLISVTNQKGKKLKVTWKKNAAATGYEVQYSTSSKFKSAKKVKIKKASTTSTTISKLTKGKKYYVRIRTYKTVSGKNYYSGWSAAKTATVNK